MHVRRILNVRTIKYFYFNSEILCILFLNLFFLIGCTNGIPSLSDSLSQSNTSINITGNPSKEIDSIYQSFGISGFCGTKVDSILYSIDNGSTWIKSASSSSDFNCSDQSFTIFFDNPSSELGFAGLTSESKTILIVGETSLGKTNTKSFTIIYNFQSYPTISISNVSNSEGTGGSTSTLTFTVTASAMSGIPVTVDYNITDGTATTIDSDYIAGSGTLTINPGTTSTTFNVLVNHDSKYETDETFNITLSGGSGYTTSGSTLSAVGTIANDDTPPTISIANVSNSEGTGGSTSTFTFTVTASTVSSLPVSVNFTTSNGSATTTDSDYVAGSGSLTINAGSITTTFNVLVNHDSKYETNETFNITLSGGSGYTTSGSTLSAVGTIANDDTPPTINFASSSQSQLESIGDVTIAVNLSAISGVDVSISLSTSGTATITSDYNISSSFTISAGQISNSITLSVIDDSQYETTESAIVFMSSATNANIGATDTHTVSISDNDPLLVEPLYSGNSNWNDYVRNNGTNFFNADNTPCDGTETGGYYSCIHGGEKRKVNIFTYFSCNNLSMSDSLNIFDWKCDIDAGHVVFYSVGLKAGKGLRDLITTGGVWIANSVSFKEGAVEVATSNSIPWWNNTLTDLSSLGTSGTGVISLNNSGTVYFISSNVSNYGYQLAADKISVVTLGSSKLMEWSDLNTNNCNTSTGLNDGSNNTRTLLCGGDKKFVWIESHIDGYTGTTWPAYSGIYLYNIKFSRVHQSSVSPTHPNNSFYAASLNSSNYNLVSGFDIYNVASGFELNNSDNNIIKNLTVSYARYPNANCKSISLASGSDNNKFLNTRIANHTTPSFTSYAMVIVGTYNVFSRLNVSNISTSGTAILLNGSAHHNIFTEVLSTSSSDSGLEFNGADSNIISFFTSANNSWNGIYLNGSNTDGNYFNSIAITNVDKGIQSNSNPSYSSTTGNHYFNLAISNNGTGAIYVDDITSTYNGYIIAGVTPTCGSFGNIDASCNSSWTEVLSDVASSFVGKITTSDSVNGAITRSYSTIDSILLWTGFENFFRNWGVYSANSFPDPTHRGYCSTGSCQIWDYRLLSAVTVIRNRSIFGNATNPTFTSATCFYELNGNDNIVANGMTFMKNAIEIHGDFIGNDNGLCESNESCIYAPNIGAYQGEGNLGTSCLTSGTVSNATIYAYDTNGF